MWLHFYFLQDLDPFKSYTPTFHGSIASFHSMMIPFPYVTDTKQQHTDADQAAVASDSASTSPSTEPLPTTVITESSSANTDYSSEDSLSKSMPDSTNDSGYIFEAHRQEQESSDSEESLTSTLPNQLLDSVDESGFGTNEQMASLSTAEQDFELKNQQSIRELKAEDAMSTAESDQEYVKAKDMEAHVDKHHGLAIQQDRCESFSDFGKAMIPNQYINNIGSNFVNVDFDIAPQFSSGGDT